MLATNENYGNNGIFIIPIENAYLQVVASDGFDWEHVSVVRWNTSPGQLREMTPSWDEMCKIKALFWDKEDLVVQYHPPESEYVNQHPNCLHLWRPVGKEIPLPPKEMVGIKTGR